VSALPRICYILARYRSHRRAGNSYRACLTSLGATLVDDPAAADVVILHCEPRHYPTLFRTFPILRHRYVIGYAVWEPNILSDHFRFCLGLVDEIWTSSEYCRAVLGNSAPEVSVVPHIVELPEGNPAADEALRERLGEQADRFCFYSIGRFEERKNLGAAIRAFRTAFDGNKEVQLVVKTADQIPDDLRHVPGVVSFTDEWEDDLVGALHRVGNCFVSPHCSEGWGLCITDAMANGNLVISTGYSGNMDYVTEQNSLPVAYRLEKLRNETLRYGFQSNETPQWAYVDEDDLCEKLQFAHRCFADLEPLRRRAREDMDRFSEHEIGQVIRERLHRIQVRLPAARLAL
jgi:glycosyltransferase involved in cell wall biosynthesis